MKGLVRCGERETLSGAKVKKDSGGGECISPVTGWHGGLEQKSAYHVIGRANSTFGFTVLGRCVWTRKTHHRTEGKKEVAILCAIKLTPVVALESPYGLPKMGANIRMKETKNGRNIRLEFERKSPVVA